MTISVKIVKIADMQLPTISRPVGRIWLEDRVGERTLLTFTGERQASTMLAFHTLDDIGRYKVLWYNEHVGSLGNYEGFIHGQIDQIESPADA